MNAQTAKLIALADPRGAADQLGTLRAEIKGLQDQAKVLEDFLKGTGQSSIDGDLYHVSISFGITKSTVAWKRIAEKLNASRQMIAGNTSISKPFDVVRCSAHKK